MKNNTYLICTTTLRLVIVLILSTCLISCEDFFSTTIDIEAPAIESKMVINTFVSPGQDSIGLYIDKNNALNSNSNIDLNAINADVIINNLSTETSISVPRITPLNNSIAQYNYLRDQLDVNFFNAQHEYLITITDIHREYPTATTQVKFPTKSIIKNIEFNYEGGVRIDGDEASSFLISFDDPSGEDNFYEVGIVSEYNNGNVSGRIEYTSSTDISAIKGYADDFVLLSDASFDGQEKTIELKIFRYSQDNTKFYLIWRNVSEGYFNYSRTLKTHIEIGENPFTSSIPVASNIQNGLGIVSFYQEQIIPAN